MISPSNGGPAPPIEKIELKSLSQIVEGKHEGPDWLIEEILPQGCFLVVGRPKIGKSWLLLQLAITLACGGRFLEHEALAHFDVLYVAAEDDPGRIASRFTRYQASSPPANLRFICRADLTRLAAQYAEHYDLARFLESFLLANAKIKAVIIDTESTVRAAWDGGSVQRDSSITRNDYAEVREFDELAHRRRVFIGLVNHTGKLKQSRWLDIHELINRTNTALAGASGSIVLADPPGTDPIANSDHCKVLGIRGRDITKDHLLAVEQDKYGIFKSLGPYSAHRQTERELEILALLLEIAGSGQAGKEGWVSSKHLAEVAGGRAGSLQACLTRMLSSGRTTYKTYRVEARRGLGFRLVSLTDA